MVGSSMPDYEVQSDEWTERGVPGSKCEAVFGEGYFTRCLADGWYPPGMVHVCLNTGAMVAYYGKVKEYVSDMLKISTGAETAKWNKLNSDIDKMNNGVMAVNWGGWREKAFWAVCGQMGQQWWQYWYPCCQATPLL